MLFERFEVEGLAHYSYAVGCQGAKRVAIVDPKRDVDTYIVYAKEQDVRITDILETHIHADYASGARELAERTGASLHASAYDRGEQYEVSFEHEDLVNDSSIKLGSVRIEALHTPGHTPEHLSFLIFDESRSVDTPLVMLSGDFLFVGSLGRPDLLGEEEKDLLAHKMFGSARDQIAELSDGLKICPAHGAGSMCGSGMGGLPSSTLGYERICNPYLNPKLSREGFVSQLLASVPPFPDYYRRMKVVNSKGPRILGGIPGDRPLSPVDVLTRIEEGGIVIDLRDQLAFGGGHIPGAFWIGGDSSFAKWASWILPYDLPICLVVSDPSQVETAGRALIRVGLDQVEGYLEGGMKAWGESGMDIQETAQLPVTRLHEKLSLGSGLHIIDVRTREEWEEAHIEGSIPIMAADLSKHLSDLPSGDLALVCRTGYRSTLAASVLQRAGLEQVFNIVGGLTAWTQAGFPVTS